MSSLPTDPALHPTNLSVSDGDGDAALAQQEQDQQQQAQQQQQQQEEQQLEQPQELSDTDSSEWVLPKNLAGGGAAAGGSAAGATQQQQTQQVGPIGQQQQPGSGDGAGQLYSSVTIYAVRCLQGRAGLCVAAGMQLAVAVVALPANGCIGRCWKPVDRPAPPTPHFGCPRMPMRRCATATATSPSFTTSSTTCG